jgi:hypothetical protein
VELGAPANRQVIARWQNDQAPIGRTRSPIRCPESGGDFYWIAEGSKLSGQTELGFTEDSAKNRDGH